MPKRIVALTVNGRRREDAVDDATLLLDHLREQLALTGTKRGCDGGECGACTVILNGEAVVVGCLIPAGQVPGQAADHDDRRARREDERSARRCRKRWTSRAPRSAASASRA